MDKTATPEIKTLDWFKLTKKDQIEIFNRLSEITGLLPNVLEKDLWLMVALKALFESSIGKHLVFKGGTSLSKGWKLIDRFSEDIDLAIDREFFDFPDELSKQDVKKLRRKSHAFLRSESFIQELKANILEIGISDFELECPEYKASDKDPIEINLEAPSILSERDDKYYIPHVQIQIGTRSLLSPKENVELDLIMNLHASESKIYLENFNIEIPLISAHRTCLDKILLLHEEFQKDPNEIISYRMSRHLFDILQIYKSGQALIPFENLNYFEKVVRSREMLYGFKWVDYSKHVVEELKFIPPESVMNDYKNDYQKLQSEFIYGDSEPFGELIEKLTELNEKINQIS